MMFSSHIDMIYKNSALRDIFVKLLFIEYRLSKKKSPQPHPTPPPPPPLHFKRGGSVLALWKLLRGPWYVELRTKPTESDQNAIFIIFFPNEAKYTLSYKFLIY